MLPKISIITICYNSISTIEKTILSVINQDYPNIEYIIIDGGSKDGTVDIIKKYSNRISCWVSEPDNGIYDAMNKGIAVASGEWIHFRNSGDYFVSNRVLSEFFSNSIDDDTIVIHGDQYFVKSWGYKLAQPAILTQPHHNFMPVFHPSTFVRSSYHKQNLFDTSYKSAADYAFFFDCCEKKVKFQYLPIVVATYSLDGFSSNNLKLVYYENQRVRGNYTTTVRRFFVDLRYKAMALKHTCLKVLQSIRLWNDLQIALDKKHGWHSFEENKDLKLLFS